jgi:type II secretory pathway component PulF
MDYLIHTGTLSTKERAIFARSLAALILTESSIERSLANLANGVKSLRLKSTLLIISEEIKVSSVASAIIKKDKLFGSFFTEMVKMGDSSGTLPVVLVRLAEYYDQQLTFFQTIVRKIRPPLIMITGSIGALVSMMIFLIPGIIDKITSTAGPLPKATEFALHTLVFSQKAIVPGLILLLILCFLACALIAYLNRYSSFEKIIWHFPLIGEMIRITRLERFFRALSATFSNGIQEKNAIHLSAYESKSRSIIQLLRPTDTHSSVETLEVLSGHLERHSILPPLIKDSIRPGASISETGAAFRKVAVFYQEKMFSMLCPALILLQPLAVMVTGLLFLSLLLVLYLPFLK